MKTAEFFKRAVAKINTLPLLAAFFCYQILILIRITVEMGESMVAIYTMQLSWFNCVMMFFVINFKYLLKVKNKDLPVLALGGFLTYIPLLYSVFVGHKWHLNFINPVSPMQVLGNMATLLASHEYNWPMFPELLMLLIGSFALALILSGNLIKSALTAALSLYSSFFCLGFSWFAVNPDHPSFSHLPSGFADHIAYSLYYISLFALLTAIAFAGEITGFIKQSDKKTRFFLFVPSAAAIVLAEIFLSRSNNFFALDYILISIPAAAAALSVFFAAEREWKFLFIPLWTAVLSLVVILK